MKITFTEGARDKVLSYMGADPRKGRQLLRIKVLEHGPSVFQYQFFLDEERDKKPGDVVQETGPFSVVTDPRSAELLEGSTVDWTDADHGAGFKVQNPNEKGPDLSDPVAKKIQDLLDGEINPSLANHGGFVQLIDVKGGRVYVRLGGGCHGCGMAHVTLKRGVEVRIREAVPEVTEVIDTTDHAQGQNPYYQGDR